MKRALLVGIDDYESYSPLRGCVNDVAVLTPLLARHEDAAPNFACQPCTSATVRLTREVLLGAVKRLLMPGADVALLYFAGHGVQAADDVTLVTADGTPQSPGVRVSEVLAMVPESTVGEVVIMLDCCFSGGAGGVPQLGSSAAALRPGLSMLTASRGDQISAETAADRGLFSTHLSDALEGGAADVLGKVTLAGVYAYLTESFGAWEQRPTLKANVDRLHELRRCAPAVPLEELRRLPDLFDPAEAELSLDPSYEPTLEPHETQRQADFAVLQHCRAAKLVDPVNAEHMYDAAKNSTACRLTPLGRHYRHMAAQNQL